MLSDLFETEGIFRKININEDFDFHVDFDNENNIIVKMISPSMFYKKQVIESIKLHINNEPKSQKAIAKYIIKEYRPFEKYKITLCLEINPRICKKLYDKRIDKSNIIMWGIFLQTKNLKKTNKILNELIKKG